MRGVLGVRSAVHPRKASTVAKAVRRVAEAAGYEVDDQQGNGRALLLVRPGGPGARLSCAVEPLGETTSDGTLVMLAPEREDGAEPTRAERRADRAAVVALLDAVGDDLARTAPPGTRRPRRTLADVTGRRAWLGALALLGLYLVPVAAVWGISRLDVTLFGDNRWVAVTVALVVGLGLVVALTLRLGGWFQSIDFGEQYPLTFNPVSGYALGWWRFVCQLGSLLLVALLAAGVEDAAEVADVTNAETEALTAYTERVPVPVDGEPFGEPTFYQSPYDDRANASVERSFVVPATFGTGEAEAYLEDPRWAGGDGGRPAFGALQAVECDGEGTALRCTAELGTPAGAPVEYTVELRLQERSATGDGGGPEDVGQLDVEVTYEEGG